MSVSEDDVRMNSLNVPAFPLLSEDKSRLSLGINRIAYPREKSLTLEIIRPTQNIELGEEHQEHQRRHERRDALLQYDHEHVHCNHACCNQQLILKPVYSSNFQREFTYDFLKNGV